MVPAMKTLFPPSSSILRAASCLFLFGTFARAVAPAEAAVGEWVAGAKAQIRLIAVRSGAGAELSAAIEIALPAGWKTYWRSPGDAGVAPVADFSASRNLGPVALAFPVPKREDDGYTVTNVYQDHVVLPLTAPVTKPLEPVTLSVKLHLGVCLDVCVLDEVEASLDVPSGAVDAPADKMLAEARATLPGPSEPGVFAVDKIARQGGSDKKPVFDIAAAVPDAKAAIVFVEGPPDWFPDVPHLVTDEAGRAVFRVTFDRLGSKTEIPGAALRVTIVSGRRAIEQTVSLD
jgi:suppressor for copper-sensitivity B